MKPTADRSRLIRGSWKGVLIPQLQGDAYRLFIVLASIVCGACRRGHHDTPRPAVSVTTPGAGVDRPHPRKAHAALPSASAVQLATSSADARPRGDAGPSARLRLGKRVELGVGYPLSATSRGVVFRVGRDAVRGWEFQGGALVGGPPPSDSPAAGSGPSWGPPAVTEDSHAYWVSQGRVVRDRVPWDPQSLHAGVGASPSGAASPASPSAVGQTIAAGPTIAANAVNGARISATTAVLPDGQRRDVVAFISAPSTPGGDMVARVWVEKVGTMALSPEGAGASAVALRSTGSRVAALMLDGRAAMSPLHARWLDISAERGAQLEPDTVLFVGPPPEGRAEVALAVTDEGPVAVMPLSKDATHFGLAIVKMGWTPKVDSEPTWSLYPNGIDPAPVAAAELCGGTYVAYARPASAAADAPAVVALAPLVGTELGAELALGEASSVAFVALAEQAKGGGVVAWVADGRTYGRTLGCS